MTSPSYINIRIRRDSATNWAINNPILKIGEPGLETDTKKLKFGDGSTPWNNLDYISASVDLTTSAETIDDRVAALITAGENIKLSYNDNNNTLNIAVTGVQPSGNYSLVGHDHTTSNINDFNVSVSGLLPSVSGTGYINTSFENNIYTISVSGLQPSGNYVELVNGSVVFSELPLESSIVYPVGAYHVGGAFAFNNWAVSVSPTYGTDGYYGDLSLLGVISRGDLSIAIDLSSSVTKYISDNPGSVLNYASLEVVLIDAANRIVGWGTTSTNPSTNPTNGTNGSSMTISIGSFPSGISSSWILGANPVGVSVPAGEIMPVAPYKKISSKYINGVNYVNNATQSSFNSKTNAFHSAAYGGLSYPLVVGSTGRASYYGTYDQNGNVEEYIQSYGSATRNDSTRYILRGGSFLSNDANGQFPISYVWVNNLVSSPGFSNVGFRVASPNNSNNYDGFVVIGDPDNFNHPIENFGKVPNPYYIGKYTITNQEYVDFLNAVAATDTKSLYDTQMSTDIAGGINRSGSSGSYTYSVKPNYGQRPVNFVTWFSSIRYCNWLHNNKPTGQQDNTTTESGAYTILNQNTIINPNNNAKYRLPTENEWFKAARYKGGSINAGYWKYATQSDTYPDQTVVDVLGGGFNKSLVGLNNVDNTSDINKPISTATQTALGTKLPVNAPVFDLGTISGTNAINFGTDRLIQTTTLNGTAVTFSKGTGWPSNSTSVDIILQITVTSATAITWSIVTDWYNQPGVGSLTIGTHLFLLRAVGASIIQGHYIGSKTN